MLVDVISPAKSSLVIAIYSLTQKVIVAAILDAKKRGLAVRNITDRIEAKNKTQAEVLKNLKAAGIPIKQNTHSGLMHLKVTIVDKSIFTTDHSTTQEPRAQRMMRCLWSVHDAKMAGEWDAQFERMWNDTKGFEDFK